MRSRDVKESLKSNFFEKNDTTIQQNNRKETSVSEVTLVSFTFIKLDSRITIAQGNTAFFVLSQIYILPQTKRRKFMDKYKDGGICEVWLDLLKYRIIVKGGDSDG